MFSFIGLIGLPQASTLAANFDRFYSFIFWTSFVSFVIIVIGLVWFVIAYRQKKGEGERKTPYITGHGPTEAVWSISLFILVMVIFFWGWVDYRKIIKMPDNALEINVIGKQWVWDFWYLNGRHETNELVVPKGRKVKLLMSSSDVIHSFFVPEFRLKNDVVPGSYTTLWFEATQTGEFQVLCAEYCGTAHSTMLATLKVVEPEEYEQWQRDWKVAQAKGPVELTPSGLIDQGKKLFTTKGCNACHTVTGQKLIGPTMKGNFGSVSEMSDGSKVTVDEKYLRESLMDPQAKLVKGYPPVMPTFRGQLTDEETNALIAYIKSLK